MIEYIEGSVIGVPKNSPTGQNPVVFVNSYTGAGVTEHPPGQWTTFDVSALVPEGTKAIRLDGILIITHGNTVETADLTVAFRADQSWEYGYIMQTIEASVGNGQRSNAGAWVAIDVNRCFQMKWTRSTQGQWPANSCYAINLSLTAYLRSAASEDAGALVTQLNALSDQVVSVGSEISELTQRIASLEQSVMALQAIPPGQDPRMTALIANVAEL